MFEKGYPGHYYLLTFYLILSCFYHIIFFLSFLINFHHFGIFEIKIGQGPTNGPTYGPTDERTNQTTDRPTHKEFTAKLQ